MLLWLQRDEKYSDKSCDFLIDFHELSHHLAYFMRKLSEVNLLIIRSD